MRRSIVDTIHVPVTVPRGQDNIWAIMRKLDADGPFSIPMITRDRSLLVSVRDYIARLMRAERPYIARTGGKTAAGATLYRLTRHPVDAPRLRADGSSVTQGLANEQMWTNMGYLPVFTAAELAIHSSTEEVRVALTTAQTYCRKLTEVGYLVVVDGGSPGKPSVYRRRPGLGARAPMILRTKFVFDPNINQVVGTADAREVRP